jgi:ribokinase
MAVLVYGSLNMDLVVQCPRLPLPGETLLGKQFDTISGGKGANQAVALARQQIPTLMVGRVGADHFGHELRHALALEGVDIDAVYVDESVSTGIAAIAVAATGDNHIVIVPGANGRVGQPDLKRLKGLIPQTKSLLLQFEIPTPAVVAAAQAAHAARVTVILDPAPVAAFDPQQLYPQVDILTPNQVEASQLVGFGVETTEQAAEAIATLQEQGATTVIVKLGEQGVVCGTPDETFHIPAFTVDVVDTVAAGDAFNGGLAAALHEGKPLKAAIVWATATAALSVTLPGAQPSLPTRSQVDIFLQKV